MYLASWVINSRQKLSIKWCLAYSGLNIIIVYSFDMNDNSQVNTVNLIKLFFQMDFYLLLYTQIYDIWLL